MKSKEEIEQLAFLEYPRVINDPYNPIEDDNTYERKIWIGAYTKCQEDIVEELKEWIEITLSAKSKLGASDNVIEALLGVKYKIESLTKQG